jgi:hypothetical protein
MGQPLQAHSRTLRPLSLRALRKRPPDADLPMHTPSCRASLSSRPAERRATPPPGPGRGQGCRWRMTVQPRPQAWRLEMRPAASRLEMQLPAAASIRPQPPTTRGLPKPAGSPFSPFLKVGVLDLRPDLSLHFGVRGAGTARSLPPAGRPCLGDDFYLVVPERGRIGDTLHHLS